jgi:hypothetical protein
MQDAIAVYLANKGLASGATKDEMCRDLKIHVNGLNHPIFLLKKNGFIESHQDIEGTIHTISPEGFAKYSKITLEQNSKDEQMIEQFKPLVDMFIEQWKEPLKKVNFDRIGLISSIPKAKIFLKTSLHLPGITAFLRENILS